MIRYIAWCVVVVLLMIVTDRTIGQWASNVVWVVGSVTVAWWACKESGAI